MGAIWFFDAVDPTPVLTFVPLQVSSSLHLRAGLHLGLPEWFPDVLDMTMSWIMKGGLLATHFGSAMLNQYFLVVHVGDATFYPSHGR